MKAKPAFKLLSPDLGTDYRIFVEVPDAVQQPGPWPVVLFMDGDDQFGAAVTGYRAARAANAIPPLLLVGVGYGASYSKPANKRGRDYTPVAHRDEPTSGGADGFLNFLVAVLWPELLRRFPVDPNSRGIAGHSLGSLLVLHALFQPKPFFTHHLASAPSIWWAERAILKEVAALRAKQSALSAWLFLGVGEEDSESMTGDLDLLERQVAAQPFSGLKIISRRFSRRNHFNVLPEAFTEGLAALWPEVKK